MKINELIEKLRKIQDSKGNIEVIVQDYGRKDAPRAFSAVEYTSSIRIKTHTNNDFLYEADHNPEMRARDAKYGCLIAHV